ncbi:MAG: DUF3043 domain-containing protein [Aeriscardovia sp.]|nr:DUF3043 domain-containing protein [Aeriscardovia sp.]
MKWNLSGFKKKKKGDEEEPAPAGPRLPGTKKAQPTLKRKEAQKLSYLPLVPDPKDRKERNKVERKRARLKQDREYVAMETGDVANMPKAERSPIRTFARDWIDARYNLGEFFIPIALVLLIGSISLSSYSSVLGFVLAMIMYVYMVAVLVDLTVLWITLKRSLIKHGKWDGNRSALRKERLLTYAISRAIQIRRFRVPKPVEKHRGHWPD